MGDRGAVADFPPGFLTAHQQRVVDAGGNVFLTACPGSGKTRAGGARVARLIGEGVRVAACSYTNVGVAQIRQVVTGEVGVMPTPAQFTGTLHSFLLRYVLHPFGHLVTGGSKTPQVMDDGFSWDHVIFDNDPRIWLSLDRFAYRPDGSLCVRGTGKKKGFKYSAEEAALREQRQALRLKERVAKTVGVVSFDDAMFWALRVLEQFPAIAGDVAGRFDELLIDEAQDTSELQLACVDALMATGRLGSLYMIGDLEQSICSFNGADRAGCERLAADHDLALMELSENHRSSQRICDVAVHFCSRPEADTAVGPDSDCEWHPELVLYPEKKPAEAVRMFQERLAVLGEPEDEASILARNNDLVDDLNGDVAPVEVAERPLAIGRAVATLRGEGTLGRREIEKVDRIVAHVAWDVRNLGSLSAEDRWRLRKASMKLLAGAPDLGMDLREWIRESARQVGVVASELHSPPANKSGNLVKSAAAQAGTVARAAFTPVSLLMRARTVHNIKGESQGSVLVVVDRTRSRKRGPQSELWSRALAGEPVSKEEAEELRIAFVALTRARRFCMLALPDSTPDDVLARYVTAGFAT